MAWCIGAFDALLGLSTGRWLDTVHHLVCSDISRVASEENAVVYAPNTSHDW